jgi:hypothetical protein
MRLRAIRTGLTAAITLCCLLGAQTAQAQKYRLVNLGPGIPTGIANDGTISGHVRTEANWADYYAAVWKTGDTGPTLLGKFPGDVYSTTSAISGAGTVLGYSYRYEAAGHYQIAQGAPFTWTAATGLQALPWQAQHTTTGAHAINNLGHISSSSSAKDPTDDRYKPFLWRPNTGITYLDGIAGTSPHYIKSLNDQDQGTGTASDTNDPQMTKGFFWSPSTGVKSISSPSSTYSDIVPTTINSQGQVAGFLRDPKTGRTKLFTWSARYGTTNLMLLNSYAEELVAVSIDKNYRVIGNRDYFYRPDGNNPPVGFVWSLLTGLKDIHSLIVDNGPASAPVVTLNRLVAVNESGQIVASARINDQPHVVRLDPVR